MKKFGLALVGCGRIANEHLNAYKAANQDIVDLVAVCDVDYARALEYQEKFGARYAYRDIDELLKNEEVEGVILTLPHHVHHDLTVKSLRAGKHVLVEKIMSTCYEDSLDMVRVAEECGKTLMVGQTQRFTPGVWMAKEMVEEGKIGRIFNITESWNQHLAEVKTNWWGKTETAGGGFCIPTQGVHSIDAATWIMGNRIPVRIYAQSFRLRDCWEGEDDFSVLFTYADGSTVTMHVTYDVTDRDSSNHRIINGAEGTLIVERWATLVKYRGEVIYDKQLPGSPHMEKQMREFVTAIREGREPVASGREIAPINAIVDAVLESAQTHKAIEMRERYPELKYE